MVTVAPFRCCAPDSHASRFGSNSLRVPLAPPFAATANVDQLRRPAPLEGVSGPRPLFRLAWKFPPAPCGIAKQFVQLLPSVALKALAVFCGEPIETMPGME